MQKRSLSRLIESTRAAIRIINGGAAPRPSERALIIDDLGAVIGDLEWLQANGTRIRELLAADKAGECASS